MQLPVCMGMIRPLEGCGGEAPSLYAMSLLYWRRSP